VRWSLPGADGEDATERLVWWSATVSRDTGANAQQATLLYDARADEDFAETRMSATFHPHSPPDDGDAAAGGEGTLCHEGKYHPWRRASDDEGRPPPRPVTRQAAADSAPPKVASPTARGVRQPGGSVAKLCEQQFEHEGGARPRRAHTRGN